MEQPIGQTSDGHAHTGKRNIRSAMDASPLQETVALVAVTWILAETLWVWSARLGNDFSRDARSLALIGAAAACTLAAGAGAWMADVGRLSPSSPYTGEPGLLLMLLGLLIRGVASEQLGAYFTPQVTILKGHRVVQIGMYRFIRHPGYLGGLLALAGALFAFFRWPLALALCLPALIAILYRIAVEETALREAVGERYVEYCRRTWRLIPGLY